MVCDGRGCAWLTVPAAINIAIAAASVHTARAIAARRAPWPVRSAGVAHGAQSISTVTPPLVPRGERERILPHSRSNEADAPSGRFFHFSALGQRSVASESISVLWLW